MAETEQRFYECENVNCGLRFPGYDGFPRWNRCPSCRSNTSVVAVVNQKNHPSSRVYTPDKLPIAVLLDNIRSALNVGSIFRTSDGTGVRKIYTCGITPTPDNLKVQKTALGAEGSIQWEKFNNGVTTAKKLKTQGSQLWALEDLPDAVSLYQIALPTEISSLVLIVGNEVSGIDPGIVELCDKIISIPMVGKKNSYNVAVAFAIAASYLFYRQNASQESVSALPNT